MTERCLFCRIAAKESPAEIDTLDRAGPNPARLAKTLEYSSRKDFVEDYRRAAWVRALYDRRRAQVRRPRQEPGARVMRAPSERSRSSIRS